MKVNLEKIRLGHSPLTGNIFAGTIIKEGVWRNKVNVTDDFIACIINKYCGFKEVITDKQGNKFEIVVRQINIAKKKKNHK